VNNTRRSVIKAAASTPLLAALIASGLLSPAAVFAAEWNKAAFDSKDLQGALRGIGAGTPAESKDLILRVPDIAENGAVVPVDVVSNIPNTTSISILVEKNPAPLCAHFEFANGALPEASARLKMGQTSMVKVVAKADGKFYTAQKEVKVTVGGCGG
jgi:sulfur-oxidizing protein SoxY